MTSINYVELNKSAKNAARDVLRTEKVQALIGYKTTVDAKIVDLNASVERAAKNLAREEYELRIATQFESPDLADITKRVEEARESHAKFVANVNKAIEEHNAKLAEYDAKIENWNNGTSKVDTDRMNEMALKFVKDKIGADFNMGLYEAANTNAS